MSYTSEELDAMAGRSELKPAQGPTLRHWRTTIRWTSSPAAPLREE